MRPNTECTAMFYVTSVMASTRSSAVMWVPSVLLSKYGMGSFYRTA